MENCNDCKNNKFYQNFKKHKKTIEERIKILTRYIVYHDLEINKSVYKILEAIENEENF